MSAVIDNDYQTNLLFKRFTGVAATQLDQEFSNEPYRSITNIFSRDINIEAIPSEAPIGISVLDNSGSWADSISGAPSLNAGQSFSQLFPDSKIEFYKNVSLAPVPGSNSRVWYYLDGQGNNTLRDTINFKFDDVNSTYLMRVKYNNGSAYINNPINSFPLFWVMDNQSGYLQLYQDTATLSTSANIPASPPKLSYFRYIGLKGLTNLDISGQQQVADISGVTTMVEKLNRMILPDGYVDISGTNYSLLGEETVRTYYTYNRARMFVGYDNLPILDGSAVDHTGDPSHNNIAYQLDVSGRLYLSDSLCQYTCTSTGTASVAFGAGSHSSGLYSFAVGAGNLAPGNVSFAQGISSTASGLGSHCEGTLCDASGSHSHAEGDTTKAVGYASHSEGSNTYALQHYSHAGGIGTVMDTTGGTSVGWYNDLSQNVFLVVGCGTSDNDRMDALYVDTQCTTHVNKQLDVSGDLMVTGHSDLVDVSCANIEISQNIVLVGDMSMNGGQITFIGNATDPSGVPSLGQVEGLVEAADDWTLVGNDIYNNNPGNVGIGTTGPSYKLDVVGQARVSGDVYAGGNCDISRNAFVSTSATQSAISSDHNLYVRNTNLVDTLKIGFNTFFERIWVPDFEANKVGQYTSPSTGLTQVLSAPNPGKPSATPTFAGAWGPSVIPIAYLDINQNYDATPFDPTGAQHFQTDTRPDIANTMAYFTVKLSEPYDAPPSSALNWKSATLYPQHSGTFKAGLAAIPEQTITFVAGYTDNFKRTPGDDLRKPKPFIKVLSTNIPNLKCLTGITVDSGGAAADIAVLTQQGLSYGYTPDTPKIGGLVRIIIAESCPGLPTDKNVQNKAWLLLEQQWNYEPWQLPHVDNSQFIRALADQHVISVRMYANNIGDLNLTRNPPFNNDYNTDWQLVTEDQILDTGIYSWEKFVLPMGGFAAPPVFNVPTIVPPTDISYTLMVGGTECPDPLSGTIPSTYPAIITGANLWEVWLNLADWPYGVTTTEEVFENRVSVWGDLDVSGNFTVDGTLVCNDLDVINSIDVGANQYLRVVENKITSTNPATNWAPSFPGSPVSYDPGLWVAADNFYFDCTSASATRGAIISLGDNTSNSIFRIVDNNNSFSIAAGTPPLFQVEGSGLTQTQSMIPWIDMCYNLGIAGSVPSQNKRYKNLYVGGVDTSGNVDVSGSVAISGGLQVQDLSATNIDVANDLNVEGLITGIADTTFVEYRDYTSDIPFDASGWYCIARTDSTNPTGGQDNARGLFILDDDTSGERQQIIFYAGTSYSRGNYLDVVANNWYGTTPPVTNMRIDVSGTYTGANIMIYREATSSADDVHVRLYENGREAGTGGRWVLTATPIAGLSTTAVSLDLTYDPEGRRANSVTSLDTYVDAELTAPRIKNIDLSGQRVDLAAGGHLRVEDNQTGAASNRVIDVDSDDNIVWFGGYDYTDPSSGIIGDKVARDRVVVDLEAGSAQFALNVADSGSVVRTLGGIEMLPLQTNTTGAPPLYAAPGWGASLFLGRWGWGNQSWNNYLTARLSQRTNDQNRPGSGNVYCNAVRQNIVHTAQNSQGPVWSHGWQGANPSRTMYYNQGDIRYIVVDPTNGTNHRAQVTLPTISTPMLGQAITVTRTSVPTTHPNYKTAVYVQANTPDRIGCPPSIFVNAGSLGGIALDPYNDISGGGGVVLPVPYKGTEISSVTLVASQNGYYTEIPSSSGGGGTVTSQFVWQFVSSGLF
jgi:hypothetical protein